MTDSEGFEGGRMRHVAQARARLEGTQQARPPKANRWLRSSYAEASTILGLLMPHGTVLAGKRPALRTAHLQIEELKGMPVRKARCLQEISAVAEAVRTAVQRAAASNSLELFRTGAQTQ